MTGPKISSSCGRVGVVGQVEDGGLDVVALVETRRAPTTEGDLGPVFLGEGDVALATLSLAGADQRAHEVRRIGRVADRDHAVGGATRPR